MEQGQGRTVDVVHAGPMMEVAEAGGAGEGGTREGERKGGRGRGVGEGGGGLLPPRGHKVVESRGIMFLQRLPGRGNYCQGIINGC